MSRKALTTFEAAELCGVHHRTIARWVQKGYLKAFRTPGGHIRIQKEDLEEFIANHQMTSTEEIEGTIRVLIVDDEEAFRESAVKIMNKHAALEVRGAKDGYTAGWMLGSFKPEVVVLDLMMPDVDGFEICQKIRTSSELQNAGVIVLTGYANRTNIQKAFDCGADMCLPKPVDLDDLQERVLMLAREHGLLGADV